MNRKERRKMAKKLGILQYQSNLSRNKKFNLIRENILEGKRMHEEFVRRSKLTQQELEQELKEEKIYNKAIFISQSENIPFSEAVERAKKEIEEEKKYEK